MELFSVRQKQIERATSMLNMNTNEFQSNWKFLIYDIVGQNVLAPLLSVDRLKNENVTQHLAITSRDREPVPDVSAIYFVLPTDKNIELICKDLTNHLYDSYYLNFISPITRTKLEEIADASLMSDSAALIKSVYDQYLNFITLEDDLFILREHEKQQITFKAFNRVEASEDEIHKSLDLVVECLFSVLITLNVIPIIRCPKGGPAEFIADRLDKRIRETLRDEKNCLYNRKELSLRKRPLLCLVDRNIDLSTPLHHAWTYQALIHDTLNIQLNKVDVVENDKVSGKSKPSHFELDPCEPFWVEQRGNPFPQVAEAIQISLEDHKKREEDLNNLRSSMGLDDPSDELGIAESTAKLKNAALSLPELSKNKAILKKHTTVAAAVLDELKARKIDIFFELEEKIMNRNLIDRIELDEILTTPGFGNASDKYRLFLISFICDNPQFSEDEYDRYMTILESFGCNKSAFEYLREWKAITRHTIEPVQSNLLPLDGGVSGTGMILNTAGMFSKLMSKGSKFVMEGVKNLVLREHNMPLTRIIDGLMDTNSRKSKEALQYKYLDPKTGPSSDLRINSFKDAILFVVGGGNYIEYQNLVDYCRSKNQKVSARDEYRRIIYGATDLMNAQQFLDELSSCID